MLPEPMSASDNENMPIVTRKIDLPEDSENMVPEHEVVVMIHTFDVESFLEISRYSA